MIKTFRVNSQIVVLGKICLACLWKNLNISKLTANKDVIFTLSFRHETCPSITLRALPIFFLHFNGALWILEMSQLCSALYFAVCWRKSYLSKSYWPTDEKDLIRSITFLLYKLSFSNVYALIVVVIVMCFLECYVTGIIECCTCFLGGNTGQRTVIHR